MRHGIVENITHLNRCDCFADHACNAPCRARGNCGVHCVTGSVKSARPVSAPLDLAEVSGGSRRSADHVHHGIRVHRRHTEDADASHEAAGSGHECVAHAKHSSLHRGVRRCLKRVRSAAGRGFLTEDKAIVHFGSLCNGTPGSSRSVRTVVKPSPRNVDERAAAPCRWRIGA